jgi:hypothetical protein
VKAATLSLTFVQSRAHLHSAIAVLHLMCDDREWTVRKAAIKSIVLVECGHKILEGRRNENWKPAGKRIMVSLSQP